MSAVPLRLYHQAIRYQDQSKYDYYLLQIVKLHVSILYTDHHQLDDDDDDPCIVLKHVA